MENINLYLTIMFWLYMVRLILNTLVFTLVEFPVKIERKPWYYTVTIAEYLFFLYWITQLRGVV